MAKGKNAKRDMILETAYDLFLNKGYWDTKIIDIADAAGIGKGTVYEYFESKDEIFFELFKTKVAAGYENLSELLDKEVSCEKKIKEYLDTELTNTSKYAINKSFLIDLMMKSDAFRNPALIESIHELVKKKFSILLGIIKEGIKSGEFRKTDPELAAISLMGAINFFISINYMHIEPFELLPQREASAWNRDEFLDLILHGLKP
jgi:TetR/AcrR family fatty acid metabolism transcriptional regulator